MLKILNLADVSDDECDEEVNENDVEEVNLDKENQEDEGGVDEVLNDITTRLTDSWISCSLFSKINSLM